MDTVLYVSAWSAAYCNHYNWQRCCHNAITLIASGTIFCTSVEALDLLIHFQSGNAPLQYFRPVWKGIKHSSLPHPIIQMTKHCPFILIMGPHNQDWETPCDDREFSLPLPSSSRSPFRGLSWCDVSSEVSGRHPRWSVASESPCESKSFRKAERQCIGSH